jgi:quinol monooxygenase YgiN
MTIIITATTHVRGDMREHAIEAAHALQSETLHERGCIEYRFWTALEDPDAILALEIWESEEALQNHLRAPHVALFNETLVGALDAPLTVTRHDVSSSGPLRH